VLLFVLGSVGLAQSVVVGTRAGDGKISFEAADDFQMNGSRKIRLAPEGTGAADPDAIRRLPKIDIAQAGLLRGDPSGRIFSLNGPRVPRDLVLPENPSASGRVTLSVGRNKRPLAPEMFFVALFGNSSEELVRDFVQKDWAFANLDEQLAAMRGFAASFPASAAFRDSLERRISAGLARLEEGGPYSDFLAVQRFSQFARQAFPSDAALEGLDHRVADRMQFLAERPKLLRSLAALGDWDTLLAKYQDFERYESSFPEMQALRQEALGESARMHALRARAFEQRGDFEHASQEAALALARDPANRDIRKLAGDEKLLASQGEAQSNASRRRILPKGLPADVRFANALGYADRAIADKDFKKAQESIQDAERENPGAPEVVLERAKLLAAQGRTSEALPLLDQYDRLVTDPGDREKGLSVRRQVASDLDKLKDATRQQIAALLKDGQYSELDELMRGALKLDGEDPGFLYQAGVTAAILRDGERAKTYLNGFLAHSNAIGVDPKQRDRARRILFLVQQPKAPERKTDGDYDAQSLAFRIPIDSVSGNKARMAYNWANGRLESIRTTYDDNQGAQAYRALVVAGAADSGALSAASISDPGNFFFVYHPNGALREVLAKNIAVPPKPYRVHVTRDDKGRVMILGDDGRPEVVLPDHPYVDPQALAIVEGAPVTWVIAGSSFFNPFLWDGIHAFNVQYDRQGRMESAQEWNADNLVRFSWEGNQLVAVRAYRKGSDAPYYQRTISYSGSTIMEEDYSVNGRAGKVKYIYAGKNLQQVKIENEGKEWTARVRP
jgi:tetratricopeptide (TPR) repeat protein